jgi:L-ascorbate metabolism protein UlaG (beta-lactamase superfamily)
MRALTAIDVAFVCMNLPYTMDVMEASNAVLAFKPKIVYPYHYRGQDGLSDVNAFKNLVDAGNKKIEVRLRNWYPGK